MSNLDPHWEWHEVQRFGERPPRYIRGRCNHLEVVAVRSIDGDTLAHLCITCDEQLPAEWGALPYHPDRILLLGTDTSERTTP